jgi:copper chaperone CopZ
MNRNYLWIGLFFGLTFLAGCSSQVTLAVPDMMCEDGCAAKVRDVLAKQPGVKQVNVDFPKRVATLSIDESSFSAEDAVAELVDHGFKNSKLKTDNLPVTPTAAATPTEVQAADTKDAAPPAVAVESNNG